jgi:hypothetical protein
MLSETSLRSRLPGRAIVRLDSMQMVKPVLPNPAQRTLSARIKQAAQAVARALVPAMQTDLRGARMGRALVMWVIVVLLVILAPLDFSSMVRLVWSRAVPQVQLFLTVMPVQCMEREARRVWVTGVDSVLGARAHVQRVSRALLAAVVLRDFIRAAIVVCPHNVRQMP